MDPYSGNRKPFFYALFAPADRGQAMDVLEKMAQRGYCAAFEKKRAQACIRRAAAVLLFVTPRALADEGVRKAVADASDQNKPILAIHLEETLLSPGMSLLLGQTQGILKYREPDDTSFYNRLFSSPLCTDMQITPQQKAAGKRQTGLLIGLLCLLLTGAAAFLLSMGRGRRVDPDSLLGRLGVSGNLNDIRTLYVYGEDLRDSYEVPDLIPAVDGATDELVLSDGRYPFGTVTDVSDFALLKNLEELSIAGNQVQTIAPLLGLRKLRLLDVSGNHGIDLTGISALTGLETLNVAFAELTDEGWAQAWTEMLSLPALKTLYVSVDQIARYDLTGAPFEVVSVHPIVRTYEELTAALADSANHSVYIYESLTIPEGETVVVPRDVKLGGAGFHGEFTVQNYGTVELFGCWEMGLCDRQNHGVIQVMAGGLYTGGMCDTATDGAFVVEPGGRMNLERGSDFRIVGGEFRNQGDIYITDGGTLRLRGGELVNDGSIHWDDSFYAGIYLDGGVFSGSGQLLLNGEPIALADVEQYSPPR